MPSVDVQDMRAFFDDYVVRDFPGRRATDGGKFQWPGDEWVTAEVREATYSTLLEPPPGQPWRSIVEIGPGSGKYSEMLLDRSMAKLIAFELSPALLESMHQRCATAVASGRLDGRPIDWTSNDGLLTAIGPEVGKVDLFFAVDVFLMMDFQSTLAYLVSAANSLRVGGRFAATFGDADTQSGWDRMIRDTRRHSAFSLQPDTRFHWLSKGFLDDVFTRLGFRILTSVSGPDGGDHGPLDIARRYIVAELVDPAPGQALRRQLSGEI